jgi:hypothetical protein
VFPASGVSPDTACTLEDQRMPDARDANPEAANTGVSQRLRSNIDSGRTRDKVRAPHPAAAPLGTDAEAGEAQDEDGLRIAREAGPRPSGGKEAPGE